MFKKIAALEWRNLKASRWLHITLTLMFILILFAILNRSYHHDAYLEKLADTRQTEMVQFENFVADLDSVHTGVKEISNHSINPMFPFSLEIRLVPRALFTPGGLAVVAIGQSDVHAGIYPVRTFSDPINKATVYYNPVSDLIGGFDLAFVIVFLIPLVVIAVSYNVLSEERESGTLQMILSQPVSLLGYLSDKLLFRFLVVYGSIVAILLISFLVTGTSVVHFLQEFIILSALIALYVFFWFAVSLLVNLFGKSSSFNATVLIGVWMLLVLIVPTLLHLVVQQVHEVPSRSEALVNLRNAEEDAFSIDRNEILDRYFMEHPEFIEAAEGSPADEQWREIYEYYKWFYVVRLNIAEAVSPIVDNYYESLFEQQAYAKKVSAYSPAVVLKEAMSLVAGTSVDHYNHFHASTEGFRLEWMSFIRNKMLREEFITHDDLEQLPRFTYDPEEVDHGTVKTFSALSLHLILVLGLIFLTSKRRLMNG